MDFKSHFKDKKPVETFDFLKSTLDNIGLEIEEEWQDESTVNTFSLRVVFKGTKIGSNGKGVSKELARASAYAELFERFQNGLLVQGHLATSNNDFIYFKDEKWMSTKELIEQDSKFIEFYFESTPNNCSSDSENKKLLKSLQKVDKIMFDIDDKYICLPFYNVSRQKVEYLPKNTYFPFYGSNGMCAGNTPEEALVQGYSEIIERLVQKKLFLEKPNLPDIPENYIKQYEYIYNMYIKLKNNNKYIVKLKDCSFGGKYPVAGLFIIEKNTGNYGVKLGCHPNYAIAMERTFTEAAQGQDILEYTNRSKFDFENTKVTDAKNIYNSYKVGMAQYPYQIFEQGDTYFSEQKDILELSNRDILRLWTNEILNEGYEILIRDVSYTGFPSYHIIIPGLSEMYVPDLTARRAHNTRAFISKKIENDIDSLDTTVTKYIISTMNYYMGDIFEDTLSAYYSVVDEDLLPCESMGAGCSYLVSMCYAMEGNYRSAEVRMKGITDRLFNMHGKKNIKDIGFYKGVQTYFGAMKVFKNHNKAMDFLRMLFDDEILCRLDDVFKEPKNIIKKQYPNINDELSDINSNIYSQKKKVEKIANAFKEIQNKANINQNNIKKLYA
ncbi:YcaO-like family protein [Tissierella carlieri]|uniref:YcaO-like family protein n=1 Tax=Tissierella carlieri TaxID=689904 RepID=A0ABT1SFT9_9FIRM|nr:YcaO-like family protein [Tissierella carlieri]MCQ4925358.1 YcaO-like family protein [Tissierella carlieri]